MSLFSLLFNSPAGAALIHGAVELEHGAQGVLPQRLPHWARAQAHDAQLAMAAAQPSGVRLVFETAASLLELVTLPSKRAYAGMPPRPDGQYDLLIDGRLLRQASASGGTLIAIDPFSGAATTTPGAPQMLRFLDLPAHLKTVELWLPHDETSELIELRADAPVMPVAAPGARRWLHHGSSISQGSTAASPSGTWPAVAAMAAGLQLRNLGFGGSALLDPFVARTMRDLPADLISVKIGINLVNTDLMRLRAFGPAVHGFIDTIRDGHPHTPLLIVSPIYCPIHEQVPGPTLFDSAALKEGQLLFRAAGNIGEVARGKLTLTVIRQQLERIVQQRRQLDANLHYIDGSTLYGESDNAVLPLPDALHPDAATHRLIGERFAAVLSGLM